MAPEDYYSREGELDFDPWDISDVREGFTATITEAEFITDDRFGEQCLLKLGGVSEEGSWKDLEEYPMLITCGRTWQPSEGGTSMRRVDQGIPKISPQSNYGVFLHKGFESDPDLEKVIRTRGRPWFADVWIGLKLRFEYVQMDRGDFGKSDVVYPAKLIEIVDELPKGKGAPQPKGDQAQRPAKLAEDTEAALKALASTSGSYDEFVSEALDQLGQDLPDTTIARFPEVWSEIRGG